MMLTSVRHVLALALVVLSPSAQSEVLRCVAGTATEGDSRLSVAFKCGQPLLADSFCTPVYFGGPLQSLAMPFAQSHFACQQTDEWVYDRGPGNFMATVRFRAGVVQSIVYGRAPR